MAASEAADGSSSTGVATSLCCAAKAICLRRANFVADAAASNLSQAKAALTIIRPFHRGDGVSAGGLRREVVLAVALYCLCSSSLLFLNKVAVSKLGLKPGAIVVVQILVSTTLCIVLGGVLKVIPIDNAFEARRIRLFFLYVLGFVGSIYSSAMALRRSNVETVIVFRATTPLAVSILDYFFLGRAAPSIRSTMALVATALSAAAYVATDSQFVVEGFDGYIWCLVYVGIVSFDMTFGKHLVSKSVRTGVWESVFLTNCMALPVLVLFASSRGELDDLPDKIVALSFARSSLLLASSCVAFLIGYAGWLCRSLVAATTYTLIGTPALRALVVSLCVHTVCDDAGVCNKLGTVLLAVLFLDKHASAIGILALMACIAASSQYSQAPLRNEPDSNDTASSSIDVEDDEIASTPRVSDAGAPYQRRVSIDDPHASDGDDPTQRLLQNNDPADSRTLPSSSSLPLSPSDRRTP